MTIIRFCTALFASVVPVIMAPAVFGQDQPLDNKMIIEMAQKGVEPQLIIEAIRSASQVSFKFTVDDYAEFSRAKITPDILRAMSERQSRQPASAALAAPATPPKTHVAQPKSNSEYLYPGRNEMAFSGAVTVPHGATSATSGVVQAAYLRYLTSWFSLGPAASAWIGSNAHQLTFGGTAQFSPAMADRVYLVTGVTIGGVNARAFGFTDTRFAATAYAGPRIFINPHVAFDIRYSLFYTYYNGAGFVDSTSSAVLAGFSVFF